MFLRLVDRRVLVVGGGAVAVRKVRALLATGASITVVAPKVGTSLTMLAQSPKYRGRITIERRPFEPTDARGCALVFAAADRPEVNGEAVEAARQYGALVNAADDPDGCDFLVPSHIARGDLHLAICTAGKAPSFSKRLRKMLEETVGPEYGIWLELVAEARQRVLDRRDLSQKERARILERIMGLDLAELIRAGQTDRAKEEIETCISHL